MSRPKLVIIPGIGDRTRAYSLFAWVWHLHGFDVHIIPFGWKNYSADVRTRTQDFMRGLQSFGQEPLYIIGVSAGGPAAINVFANKPSVKRVVTVAAPMESFPHAIKNRLLEESIIQARQAIDEFTDAEKRHVLSVYGLYDQLVPAYMSQMKGIRTARIFAVWHAVIIFVALTFASFRLRRFLRSK